MKEKSLPNLLVSIEQASKKLQRQIEKGKLLRDRRIDSQEELTQARDDSSNWSNYNRTLITRLFSDGSVGDEYHRRQTSAFLTVSPVPFPQEIKWHRREMEKFINHLKGICEQFELYEEPSDVLQDGGEEVVETLADSFGNEVFIVHGHDDEAKLTVARFVESLGIIATILHEREDRSRTIPEKFEEHAAKASFAIILLTPDDVGASKDERDKIHPRARQNVVLELGYFWGSLGRERVCVLYKEQVELPSDIQGILYIPMDNNNGWQLKLAKEMKQAGVPFEPKELL